MVREAEWRPENSREPAGIRIDPLDQECADLAGDHWHAYRREGGTREYLERLTPEESGA